MDESGETIKGRNATVAAKATSDSKQLLLTLTGLVTSVGNLIIGTCVLGFDMFT